MSGRGADSHSWTCGNCGVSVSRIDGSPAPLPDTWISSPEGHFCLACRRQRAAEAALDAAPPDSGRDARVNLRRDGLIEFEVRRTPDLTNSTIAKACRTSASTVAATRRRLQLPEAPTPGSNRDRAAAHARPASRR